MAENCLKPLRVSSGQAKCGSKCQAKSIYASQDSFGAIIQAAVGTDPGEGGAFAFLLFFQKQLHLWIWQYCALANYFPLKKAEFVV